jgi:hypothetical protein
MALQSKVKICSTYRTKVEAGKKKEGLCLGSRSVPQRPPGPQAQILRAMLRPKSGFRVSSGVK